MLSPVADMSFGKEISDEIELAARVENLFSFKAAHNKISPIIIIV